ncbi:MAG: histidine--tRNA ligase [Candidatus Levybacteria bacterium]|nr:histidine--tRNA ligase [Candidatus Levybacteria bacterium]
MLLQTLKGFRDFLPTEARRRQFVISTLKKVFESYGFEPLETPSLEYEAILAGKYGEEGDKLMYKFTDNGKRKVALRYDQTVPLSRVVAQRQNDLPTPFKRYQIQNVWRAENTQKGRFREFLQCDIDIAGSASSFADAEILAIISDSYQALGFKNFKILVNDRSVFSGLPMQAVISIDKLKKIGKEAVEKELKDLGVDAKALDQLLDSSPTPALAKILDAAEKLGVPKSIIQFEPTLARGLDYYTGIIIEVEIEGYLVGSVGGGGRYDNLIGMFAKRQIPSVGFAFGFDRTMEAMEEKKLFSKDNATAKVLVTLFSPELADESIALAYELRAQGIPTELFLDENTKMDRQLKYADQKNIPFVATIGPDEKKDDKISLKDMATKEQKQVTLKALLEILQ